MKLADRLRAWAAATVESWADLPGDCSLKAESFYASAIMRMAADELDRGNKAQRKVSDADVRAVVEAMYKGEG